MRDPTHRDTGLKPAATRPGKGADTTMIGGKALLARLGVAAFAASLIFAFSPSVDAGWNDGRRHKETRQSHQVTHHKMVPKHVQVHRHKVHQRVVHKRHHIERKAHWQRAAIKQHWHRPHIAVKQGKHQHHAGSPSKNVRQAAVHRDGHRDGRGDRDDGRRRHAR